MARKKGTPWKLSADTMEERIAIWRDCDLNVSETARRLGIHRKSVRHTILKAYEAGIVNDEEMRGSNVPVAAKYDEALLRKRERFELKRAKGTWRKPTLIHVAPGPFMLKVFGDPHLDADGCNIDLFQSEWMKMDAPNRVYGLCVGDWFNNWIQALSHLWKHEGDPSDAWTIFEYLMEERGDALLASCSGNHDDWTRAPYDPIELIMRQHGVRYRMGAITLALYDGDNTVTVAMRHKWRGNSMYSPAHGILRGAINGWNDDIMIGGHTHQSEVRHYVDAKDGHHSLLVQIESFKQYDDYVDVHGFMGPSVAPVYNVVVDPGKPKTHPDRTKGFWDHDEAVAYLETVRGKYDCKA